MVNIKNKIQDAKSKVKKFASEKSATAVLYTGIALAVLKGFDVNAQTAPKDSVDNKNKITLIIDKDKLNEEIKVLEKDSVLWSFATVHRKLIELDEQFLVFDGLFKTHTKAELDAFKVFTKLYLEFIDLHNAYNESIYSMRSHPEINKELRTKRALLEMAGKGK